MEKLNEIDTMVKETLKNIEDGTVTKPDPTDPEEPDVPDEPTPTPAPAPEDRDEPFNPNIDTTYGGLAIDYTPAPNQVYNTEGKKSTASSGSDEYSGNSFQSFTSGTDGTNGDLAAGWQVWGTDDNYIYIISTNATTKNLTLENYTGYNNGVTLLDNICDTVYTDKTTYPGSAGQNLKLEQVLAVKSNSYTNTNGAYDTAPYTYGTGYAFPYTWYQYENSKNNSQNNRSKAYALTTQTTNSSANKQPYNTHWYNDSGRSYSMWINSNYYSMVITPALTHSYWLSSRYVNPSSNSGCYFGLQYVYANGVGNFSVYQYSGGSPSSSDYIGTVRPVVSFPASAYRLDTSSTPAKIVKK